MPWRSASPARGTAVGAEDAPKGWRVEEHHPRWQDARRATQSAHRGRRCRTGVQGHPPPQGTRSRPPQGHRNGTRCRRWCGATPGTLTPRTATQTLHRPRQAAQSADHPPIAHHARRWRTDAHRARSGARGAATHPPHQDEPQPPRMRRRGCAAYLYEYGGWHSHEPGNPHCTRADVVRRKKVDRI